MAFKMKRNPMQRNFPGAFRKNTDTKGEQKKEMPPIKGELKKDPPLTKGLKKDEKPDRGFNDYQDYKRNRYTYTPQSQNPKYTGKE